MKVCDICNSQLNKIFTKKVLEKYEVDYFFCKNCHLIQTENPYWLDEAYENTVTTTDSGYLGRNILLSRVSLIIFYFLFKKKNKFLDYAGGYGIFTRLMNNYGLNFFWSDKYTENIFAKDLEYKNEEVSAITCFECFEHFYKPTYECKKMLKICNTIFFSTKLIPPNTIPNIDEWGYYGFHHGQHVTFYSEKSLKNLANKLNLNFYSDGSNLHIMTNRKMSNFLFNIILILPKFQIDILIRKLLK